MPFERALSRVVSNHRLPIPARATKAVIACETGGGKYLSIVVASTATNRYGREGRILRYVFLTSLSPAWLMGLLPWLAANVPPFTALVPK